jgi:hypothetical protein
MQKMIQATLLLTTLGFSNTVVPSDHSDIKITIYNDNRAFVNDVRHVEVQKGEQKLVYEGVPSSVITQSVIPTFSGLQTALYSQNYMYDLISLSSMLQNSINKTLDFYTNGKNPRLSRGVLLSVNPVMIQEEKSGHIYSLERATQVIFDTIPETMITQPSLVWRMDAQKAGTLDIDLKYLTSGITWKSDYVLNLHKGMLDLRGWITVKNDSGVAYENAQITCLAGEVNKVKSDNQYDKRRMYKARTLMAVPVPAVKEESFSGYHIYKIPFRETIANKQQKQIRFIDKKGITYTQYGVAKNHYFENYKEQKLHFTNTIKFENTQANHLGISLPKGVVRMYQKDSSEQTHFIGEQRIQNIPEEESVTLSLGKLFDVVGEKKITKYSAKKRYKNVETTYSIRNQGKEEVLLKIEENIPTYGEHIRVETTCKGQCSVKKKNAFVREFSIKLKAKEKYEFTSEFEVNY